MSLSKEQRKQYREQDKANGVKVISVRLTADEYHFLALKSEQAKQTPTTYFKNAALHQMAEKRHLNSEETELLRSGLIEIRRIGNNLNQIAHSANAGISVNPDEVKYQLRYLEDLIRKHFNR